MKDDVMRDSRGTPIPLEVLEHLKQVYTNAAEHALVSLMTTGKGWAFATIEARGEISGVVVVAADTPNAMLLLEQFQRLGIDEQECVG